MGNFSGGVREFKKRKEEEEEIRMSFSRANTASELSYEAELVVMSWSVVIYFARQSTLK